jgi:hypothetical protein
MPERDQRRPLTEGHQPGPATAKPEAGKVVRKGYQPQPSTRPEGQNPPSGGSNVAPAGQAANTTKK